MSTGHSRLAASASSRWIPCTGSIALIEHLKSENLIPQSTSNASSELGTACHEIFEHCVNTGIDPLDLSDSNIKKIMPAELRHVKISAHDLTGVQSYWEYIEELKCSFDDTFAERQYDMSALFNIDLGGTADVTQCKRRGSLHIGDYKNGRVVVEHEDNYQTNIYALGAYYTFNRAYKFKTYSTSIGQPNSHHPLGPVRQTEEKPISDLLLWQDEVLAPAVEAIKTGQTTRVPGEKQCEWCEAKAFCPEFLAQSTSVAEKEFADFIDVQEIDFSDVEFVSDEEAIIIFEKRDAVLKMFDKLEERIIRIASKHGHAGPYQYASSLGNRQLITDSLRLRKVLKQYRILPSLIYTTPPKTFIGIGELERLLLRTCKKPKAKVAEIMDRLTWKAQGKPKLVKADARQVETEFASVAERNTTQKAKLKTRKLKPRNRK